jgi:hypothetical protein
MNQPDRNPDPTAWPHEKIRSAALVYINRHTASKTEWCFTILDALAQRLSRVVKLSENERPIVSCFVSAQRWYAMTTTRVFGIFDGSPFSCSPLDVTQWRWGDFKHGGRSEVEVATLSIANGTHIRLAYETGPAAMAAISYERFWITEYPGLIAQSFGEGSAFGGSASTT